MDVFRAIERRRSVRKYKPSPIPEEDLKRILESARLAPSAHNWQPWRFVVARNPEARRLLTEVSEKFIADAGCIVAALADPGARVMSGPLARPRSACVRRNAEWLKMDVMIAIEHMVLTAESLGYGTCWIRTLEDDEVKRILGIPPEMLVVALLSIGVPDEEPSPRPRKAFDEIFYEEKFGKNMSA